MNEIAIFLDGEILGKGDARITNLNGIKEAIEGELSFLSNPKYASFLETTRATAVLVSPDFDQNKAPAALTLIRVTDPYFCFVRLLKEYEQESLMHPSGIHPTAVIGENVTLGNNVGIDAHVRIEDNCVIANNTVLYANVYIGRGTTVGTDTVIYPNVVIRESTQIGDRCILHPNVSIGGDGFGFALINGTQVKIPQVGIVVLGDDVEIGANSSIDRATCGQTRIGTGTKIDNQCQIAHNVVIGEHCVIAGSTTFAGSVTVGNHVTIGGCSVINGHLEIADNVFIGGRSTVGSSIASGKIVSGHPAIDHKQTLRNVAAQRKMPQALKQLRALERRLANLEERDHG